MTMNLISLTVKTFHVLCHIKKLLLESGILLSADVYILRAMSGTRVRGMKLSLQR